MVSSVKTEDGESMEIQEDKDNDEKLELNETKLSIWENWK